MVANNTTLTAPFLESEHVPVYFESLDVKQSFWLQKTSHLAQAFLIACIFSVLSVGYVEVSYRILRYQYRNGKLKRYFPLPTNREYTSNLTNGVAFISPIVYLYYFHLSPTLDANATWLSPAKSMTYRFNPIDFLVYLVGYMFMQLVLLQPDRIYGLLNRTGRPLGSATVHKCDYGSSLTESLIGAHY